MALYEEFEPAPNRLISAQSAYLQSAAYQPVGWYEFGPDAFAEAQRQGKPILLDIGAFWCHWCHVIDRESYENPEIATLINELFIPVKVDRDERPDIDARYQTAVQLLTGQGGWPLTVFLTPDGTVFYGGTYFPPRDVPGHVGFLTLLPRLAETYKHERPALLETARALTKRLARAGLQAAGAGPITEERFQHLAERVRRRFNPDQGGFEHAAPRFSHPSAVELALLQWDVTGEEIWRHIVTRTLGRMGHGGIYDHLGGGFHRYAVDATWSVPHFEKMSDGNALLLENYVHAFRATDDPFLREIADGTLDCILRVFGDHTHGGFFSAQDADTGPNDDGGYWTWTLDEIIHLLNPDEVDVLVRYYGIRREGNMPGTKRNVLHRVVTSEHIAQALELSREEVERRIVSGTHKLGEARNRRKAPAVDTNKYVAWNALLISACLEAGRLLNREDATRFALRSADVLLEGAYDPLQGMYHGFQPGVGARVSGLLIDQVYMARAFLQAFAAGGNSAFLDTARRLMDLCIEAYWDAAAGGFWDTARTSREAAITSILAQPRKSIEDLPTPSPNAVAARVLQRLWVLTGERRYHEFAGKTLEAFAAHAPDFGPFAAEYGLALYEYLHPPMTAIVVGRRDDDRARSLWQAALHTYRPGSLVAIFTPDELQGRPFTAGEGGQARAYVCAGDHCLPPIEEAETLRKTLAEYGKRGHETGHSG